MTYIPEGSHEQYASTEKDGKGYIYSWGWLGDKVEDKNKSWEDQSLKTQIIKKLNEIDSVDKHYINCTRGMHFCEMCRRGMGNAEIYISYKGKIYICPSGVCHYIENHDYKPNDEVIEAILNGYYCTEKDLNPNWEQCGIDWDKMHLTDEEDEKMQEDICKEWDRLYNEILLRGSSFK